VDGYAAYQAVADPGRAGGPVTLANCWSHVRRRFYEIAQSGNAPIVLNRKNALFAGSDQGGVHWGVIASLIETCKLNAVDPQAYLADVLSRLVNRHPASQIDQLMPWAYANPVA
jgi:hypothetical protein